MFRIATTFVSLCCASMFADVVQWSESDGGNGHQYESLIIPPDTSWTDAVALADQLGGYLATLTSQEELDWVFSNLASDPSLWFIDSYGFYIGPYLGGFQDFSAPDYSEPAGGWSWITGEEWGFNAWSPGQPNDIGGQEVLHFWSNVGIRKTWQDIADSGNGLNAPRSIIIERDIGINCPADLTGDGQIDFFDVSTFLTLFSIGHADADWNDDGVINFFDVMAYLADFAAGCP
jgi:hypothetical protein